jgi:hypothetical protein
MQLAKLAQYLYARYNTLKIAVAQPQPQYDWLTLTKKPFSTSKTTN